MVGYNPCVPRNSWLLDSVDYKFKYESKFNDACSKSRMNRIYTEIDKKGLKNMAAKSWAECPIKQ